MTTRSDDMNDRHGLVFATLKVMMLCVVMGVVLSVIGSPQAWSAASKNARCDAVCAQSVVHTPGRAVRTSVRWGRYPFASQRNAAAIDPWGNTERQCTGYVTWALNAMGVDFGFQDRGPDGRQVEFGSASHWAAAARRGGWKVSRNPVVGSVAQWNAGETKRWRADGVWRSATAASDGHVAVVSKVFADGTALLRQYNAGQPGRSYSVMRAKAPRYLYVGVR